MSGRLMNDELVVSQHVEQSGLARVIEAQKQNAGLEWAVQE